MKDDSIPHCGFKGFWHKSETVQAELSMCNFFPVRQKKKNNTKHKQTVFVFLPSHHLQA